MEDTENNVSTIPNDKLYSQEDFDNYKSKIEAELKEKIEQEAKKASMTELELALAELEELKQKYQEKEDECLISKQKEETIALLQDVGLTPDALEFVYVTKDLEKTKIKIEALKNFVEKTKKEVIQDYVNPQIPLTSGKKEGYDPFIDGFDTNVL